MKAVLSYLGDATLILALSALFAGLVVSFLVAAVGLLALAG